MKRLLPLAAAVAAGLALAGACRSAAPTETAGAELAECPVCRHEGDLACVSVRVDSDTPALVVDGERYWFCSEDCKAACAQRPSRYLSH